MTDKSEHPEGLDEAVSTRRQRRAQWLREGERSVGQNLTMIGALGWSIVGPTLAGVFIGRWVDAWLESGNTWTVCLMFAGLLCGCLIAWQRMQRE